MVEQSMDHHRNPSDYALTPTQISHFLTHGYLHLTSCFPASSAHQWTSQVFPRLGFSPTDKSTWTSPRTNMPSHRTLRPSLFAPKAWRAICELCGGTDRLTPESDSWNDAFIVNLGSEKHEGEALEPRKLDNWHVDGDFFAHFLDSPEQGLLVIPLWTDVVPNGGGTVVCTEGVGEVARHLERHPGGVGSGMIPRGTRDWESFTAGEGFYNDIVERASEGSFHEMTGKVGDVILLHPFMLHSASWNGVRAVRIITNPPVSLKEPMRYDRVDGEHSLVERKTLMELGKERLEGWKIVGERARLVPERVRVQEKMREDERRRLDAIAEKGRDNHTNNSDTT